MTSMRALATLPWPRQRPTCRLGYRATSQQLLDLPVMIDVTDRATNKVTLDVTELDGLSSKIDDTSNSVNLVDSVSAVTGYGSAISVNRVTFEAESDGQDLTGIDFASYDRVQPANLSTNSYSNILIDADQFDIQVVGTGSFNVVGDASAFLPPSNMATLTEAASITVNNATVDQAMGLVSLWNMSGVDNLDFSIAGQVPRISL